MRCIVLLLALAASRAAAEPARVLILCSHTPEAPGVAAFAQHLRATINTESLQQVEYYREFLDFDRFPDRERWPQVARYFAEKYSGFRLDVIVAEGSAALYAARSRTRAGYASDRR